MGRRTGWSVGFERSFTGHLIVQATIDPAQRVGLLVDTGASHTVLTAAKASCMHPGAAGYEPGDAAGGALASVPMVQIERLVIGAYTRSDVRVAVMELGHLVGRLGPFDGILGLDLLLQDGFCLDFVDNRMSLVPSIKPGGACTTKARELDMGVTPQGLLELPVSSVDGAPVRAILDTGAAQTLANSRALGALGGSVESNSADHSAIGADSRPVTAQRANIPGLRIAGITIPPMTIAVADLPVFSALGSGEDPVILLGLDVFDGRVLAVDFRGRRAFLTDVPARF